MKRSLWEKNIFELIRRTSTDLPADVEGAIKRSLKNEKRNSKALWVLETILKNVEIARKKSIPICQDTGTLIFHFSVPVGFDTNAIVAITRSAVSRATSQGYLRQNNLDSITGTPFETNVADGSPIFYFQQGARKNVDIRLIMKGGGSENIGMQYSLPDAEIGAERDLEGVRKCVLHSIWKAQGNGCAPSIVGVSVGGDRSSGFQHSKEQFLRRLSEKSHVTSIARLEKTILKESKKLQIGPMGLGGNTNVLSVKIGAMSRLPASYFVTVSFMCWALRRRGALLGPEGGVQRWLY